MIPQRIKAQLEYIMIGDRKPSEALPNCNSCCIFEYQDKRYTFLCDMEFLKKHSTTLIDNIGKEIEIEYIRHFNSDVLKSDGELQITNILI